VPARLRIGISTSAPVAHAKANLPAWNSVKTPIKTANPCVTDIRIGRRTVFRDIGADNIRDPNLRALTFAPTRGRARLLAEVCRFSPVAVGRGVSHDAAHSRCRGARPTTVGFHFSTTFRIAVESSVDSSPSTLGITRLSASRSPS